MFVLSTAFWLPLLLLVCLVFSFDLVRQSKFYLLILRSFVGFWFASVWWFSFVAILLPCGALVLFFGYLWWSEKSGCFLGVSCGGILVVVRWFLSSTFLVSSGCAWFCGSQ